MIEKHTNGIWNTQLEADYSDMFNEQLPINWLEIVDVSPNVYVEPVLDNFILRYCQPGEVSELDFLNTKLKFRSRIWTVHFTFNT